MFCPDTRSGAAIAIAIPARDEAERLPRCLTALADQKARSFSWSDVTVVVVANNCTDGTSQVARMMAAGLPYRLLVDDVQLQEGHANAGGARAAAMDAAALATRSGGILLSTDADGAARPNWLCANLAAFRAGADAVAGAIDLDPVEFVALPPGLRTCLRREISYGRLLDRLAALVDPEPHDPWPRHHWHSGASVAITAQAWKRIGGLPRVATGEDRALCAAVQRAGLTLRHEPEARVTVSCRLDGRAHGGMAQTMNDRLAGAAIADPALEPARHALLRLQGRRRFRGLREGVIAAGDIAATLRVNASAVRRAQSAPTFQIGWDALQAASPLLRRRPLPMGDLPQEIHAARSIIASLTGGGRDRADRARGAPGEGARPLVPTPS
ncbi:glycosyltransferase [Roseomonas hellenica]|uniref:Glycosyltransferase n=1 Tax=Plastoroseomonas hellenica TaxID=2687306 RepID=A0ABS5EZV0_9PROT|nr:glycosyltransferase [Plastoroseomonas hellenica]MBR0665460.1 glycosyltransferase [Plastoroseomonas hellenica]